MSRTKYLFVSYWPLFGMDDDPKIPDDNNELLDRLKSNYPEGKIDGCTWMIWPPRHGVLTPVFIVPDAHRIADHVVAWSSDDPSQWFELHVVNHQGGYAVVLMPDVARSVQRWNARQVAAAGQVLVEATVFAVFRPLRFFNSAPSPLWPQIYASIPERMMLGFLDAKDACWDDPRRTASERIKFIGPFRRGDNAKLGSYVEDAFCTLGPPDFQGWTNPALYTAGREIVEPNS